MGKSAIGLIVVALLTLSLPATAQTARLHDARMSSSKQKTRVVFDLSADTEPDIFMVADPLRLVIDLPHTRNIGHIAGSLHNGLVEDIRTGVHDGSGVRVVLDLADSVQAKSFMLSPADGHRYRLVLDLYPGDAKAAVQLAASDPTESNHRKPETDGAVAHSGAKAAAVQKTPASVAAAGQADARKKPPRDVIIAIDPGHGGKDPGATGPDGIEEKTVTLAIARRLKRMIDDQPHMKAVLTRTGDYYVGLRQRMVKARDDRADFFVSIHCDASPGGGRAKGASVYALSRHGATSEHARWLQHRENAADLVGGTSLAGKNTKLASFVLDLSQSASIAASMDAGKRVLSQLDTIGELHKSQVQQAGFMVLKSPDMPSILVETNFITNPGVEHKLASSLYQKRTAAALLRGVKGYFFAYRPATYIAAQQQHRVRRGDTLSEIAQVYGVSVAALQRVNDLDGQVIRVGHTLKIPSPGRQQLASRD
jgi:N-acetylmuramoyl-L-alanine amidase